MKFPNACRGKLKIPCPSLVSQSVHAVKPGSNWTPGSVVLDLGGHLAQIAARTAVGSPPAAMRMVDRTAMRVASFARQSALELPGPPAPSCPQFPSRMSAAGTPAAIAATSLASGNRIEQPARHNWRHAQSGRALSRASSAVGSSKARRPPTCARSARDPMDVGG